MKTSLIINGKKYVPAREAAELIGYESDYIGQLIRGGKVGGKLVGRSWYIDLDEIKLYAANRSREKRGRKKTGVLGIQLKKSTVRKTRKATKGPEEIPTLPGVLSDAAVRAFWPNLGILDLPKKVQGNVLEVSNQDSVVVAAPAAHVVDIPAPIAPSTLAAGPISTQESVSTPVLVKAKQMTDRPRADITAEEFFLSQPIKNAEKKYQADKPEIANTRREIVSSGPERIDQKISHIAPSEPREVRFVPIRYESDHRALMPELTKPPRSPQNSTTTKLTLRPAISPLTTVTAQKALHPRNVGMFTAIGKLIGAGFAVSAIVFAFVSMSLVADYSIDKTESGGFLAASSFSLDLPQSLATIIDTSALNVVNFFEGIFN